MKKSHESGLATHIGPESCGAAREGGVEALTGERATVKQQSRIGSCGSRRFGTTSITWKRRAWPTSL
jgi:hypothetical protein